MLSVSSDFSVAPLPRVIRIEPSSACNLRCIHCPTGSRQGRKRGIMSETVFSRILEELKESGCADVVVLYHGGEPFLNRDLLSMVSRLKAVGVRFIKTVTNGVMVSSGMLPGIVSCGLDAIEFSLDGNSPQENDAIRRGSDFRKVSALIKALIAEKKRCGSALPAVCITCTQIPKEEDVIGPAPVTTPPYLLKEFAEYKEEIAFKNNYMLKWPGFRCGKEYTVKAPLGRKKVALNYCNHVLETTTIRANGDVVPCCYDITSQYVIGNIMRQSLGELWNNARYKMLRRNIHERSFGRLCANCTVVIPQLYVARRSKKGKVGR